MQERGSIINIAVQNQHDTVRFAADELKKYLAQMTKRRVRIRPSAKRGIRIGLMSDFNEIEIPQVDNPKFDDAIHIDVSRERGIIAGINPRSVLLAVYRFLTELGCRWVRPSTDGEYIPHIDRIPRVKISERPSYRHRGICIEGAVSEQHVKDIVEWAPKLGFNSYFIQFREAHTFFDRWYSRENKRRSITVAQARRHTANVVREIKKRDMIYHAVGHGWTCEPFGISGLGWKQNKRRIPEETRKYFALVNGKRDLWGGIALNTNLCYGNPEVRNIVIEEIARYAQEHPEIDVMHFWLADGSNNNCECEHCKDTRPSDFYVMMLNKLDELLTEKELPTKIVFLIYVDLLWPPEREKITNPDRFILMFAPITRTYSKSFASDAPLPNLRPFERNRLQFPRSVEENLAYLRAWQADFHGDSFDFDYHLMWDHFKDPGYAAVAHVLTEDIKRLRDIGINGMVSCQVQRVFLPTGLPMFAMGRILWNRETAYEKLAAEYYKAAFGPDGKAVQKYLENLTKLFDPVYIRGEKPTIDANAGRKLRRALRLITGFEPVIERNVHSENNCWARSWEYLRHHAAICKSFAAALEARARGDKEAASAAWQRTVEYVSVNEALIHPVLDVFFFVRTLGGLFR